MMNHNFVKVENACLTDKAIQSLLSLQSENYSQQDKIVYDNTGVKSYIQLLDNVSEFILDIFHTEDIENKEKDALEAIMKLRDLKQLISTFEAPEMDKISPNER